jgi:hypothetical protein
MPPLLPRLIRPGNAHLLGPPREYFRGLSDVELPLPHMHEVHLYKSRLVSVIFPPSSGCRILTYTPPLFILL